MPDVRRPLISGNWKMNLNHFEATALVQKLVYTLSAEDYATVDVSVHPPFTDIRTVQTFFLGEKDPVPIALGAQIPSTPVLYLAGSVVAAAGAALVSVILYFIFRNSAAVLDRLGEVGMLVMLRLMAFILLCIGIEIMWSGWAELNGMTR